MSEDLLRLARQVGQLAAALVLDRRPDGRVEPVETKSSPTDAVTSIDRDCEAMIREVVLAERPDDSFLGEEGDDVVGSSGVRWIVDPIDGTVNFMYGIPEHAVSIAAEVDGEVVAGYVICIPTSDEYGAVAGKGAWKWLDGGGCSDRMTLAVSARVSVSELLVATGFGYAAERRARQGRAVANLLPHIRDIRRRGSAALDLVALATGQVDAYVEEGLNPWDLAAGALIAREAGLVVQGFDGAPPGSRMTMAAPPAVAAEFFALVRDCGF